MSGKRSHSAATERAAASIEAVIEGGAGAPGNLDRLVHQPVRLAIVSALAVNDEMTFNELKGLLGLSDGNLSVHARKLEDGGYIACDKGFEGRTPRTAYRLTDSGRRALQRYLDHMAALIRAVRPD